MPGSIFRPLTPSLTTSIARDLVHLIVLVSRSRRALAAGVLVSIENGNETAGKLLDLFGNPEQSPIAA
jgi:hypothetical protein